LSYIIVRIRENILKNFKKKNIKNMLIFLRLMWNIKDFFLLF